MDDMEQTADSQIRQLEFEVRQQAQRLGDQSYALRELAHYLAEHGVSVSRFTRRTTETLVAVALNGDY